MQLCSFDLCFCAAMGAVRVLLVAGVLLTVSGCISAVAGEPQSWLGGSLLPPNNGTTWICHYRLSHDGKFMYLKFCLASIFNILLQSMEVW